MKVMGLFASFLNITLKNPNNQPNPTNRKKATNQPKTTKNHQPKNHPRKPSQTGNTYFSGFLVFTRYQPEKEKEQFLFAVKAELTVEKECLK